MRKLVWPLLTVTILVSSMLLVANVHASTPVGGIITSDTIWTETNSPYTLTSSLTVNPGVTLTIEPGVTVDLSSYTIMIEGTLNATGTSNNKIIIQTSYSYNAISIQFLSTSQSWNPTLNSGCVVENAVFNSVSITVSNCSPKITNNYLTNNQFTLISVAGGSPLISNNVLNFRYTGISASSSSSVISNNFIKGNGGLYGINVRDTSLISDNNITDCSAAINIQNNPTIQRNLITANNYGLSINSGSPTIQNNIISSNSYGIYGGGGIITNNTIGNNGRAIQPSYLPPTITQNNFLNNTQNIYMALTSDLDAPNNWWGTTNIAVINHTIYDHKNSTVLGRLNFSTFLNDPNAAAPVLDSINYLPNPTSTPYPTVFPAPTTTPNPSIYPTPKSTVYLNPNVTLTPSPDTTTSPLTPDTISTPIPTLIPTPKIMPGSPLSLGSSTFTEEISQFDLGELAKLVLIVLGVVWLVVILVSVERKFGRKSSEK